MKDRNYKICFWWNINISKSVDDHNYHFGNFYMFIIILINYIIVCGICKKYHVCRYCCKGPVTHKNLTRIYEEFFKLYVYFDEVFFRKIRKECILPHVSNSSSVFIKSIWFEDWYWRILNVRNTQNVWIVIKNKF